MNASKRQAVRLLPPRTGSLAYGIPPSPRGTLFALALKGGITAEARPGLEVTFGRNHSDVDLCLGADDQRISRVHGSLHCDGQQWTVLNLGRLPIRLPGSRLLFSSEDPVSLHEGYTPLFIRGSRDREHLLEVRIAGRESVVSRTVSGEVTQPPEMWPLADEERLVLTVLGQRYLLHEAHPQPLSWRQTADELSALQPAARWTGKRAEHMVATVRKRLSRAGVPGLSREEVGDPVGNALNHNLLTELLLSTTLVPPDLRRIEGTGRPD